jgi:hypothetical protein
MDQDDLRGDCDPVNNPLPKDAIMNYEKDPDTDEKEHFDSIIHILCFNYHLRSMYDDGTFTAEQILNSFTVFRNGPYEVRSYLVEFVLFLGRIDELNWLVEIGLDVHRYAAKDIIKSSVLSDKIEVIEWVVNKGINVYSHNENLIEFALEAAVKFDVIKNLFEHGIRFTNYDTRSVKRCYGEEVANQIFELLNS